MASRFERYSKQAQLAMGYAQEEAQRFNHRNVGTEHVLLGLVRETDGVAARVLGNLGVELNEVRTAVEFIIEKGDRPVSSENIGLTPRAKNVLELAVDEARRLNHHYIGTEHLLIGVMREGEGVAAGVLESLGVTLDKVRAEVTRLLSQDTLGGAGRGIQLPSDSAMRERGAGIVLRLLSAEVAPVVLHVLREHGGPLSSKELWSRVEALTGGRRIRPNLRTNVLSRLADDRLVRQETDEDQGHTMIELTRLATFALERLDLLYEQIGAMYPHSP